MNFHNGDSVMHWTHGLGTVIGFETMTLSSEEILHYAIQIGGMTIWVPADEMLESRLRLPTAAVEFKKLMDILSHPGEPLPANRHERKKLLLEWLKDGRAETLFRVICSLTTYRHSRPLNEDDLALMKRSRNSLLGEWSFILSIPRAQAEDDLHHRLASPSAQSTDLELESQRP